MSFYALAVFYATAFVFTVSGELKELPAQKCNHNAPDYSSCLRLAMQEAWPVFVKGIPELDVPVLDPYYTEELRSVYDAGDIHADVTVMKVHTYGLAKIRFLAVRPEYSDTFFKVESDVVVPKIFVEGEYKAEGGLGTFTMHGNGYFNISLEDITATWSMEGPVANDIWTVEHFNVYPEIGKMKIWFSNMFRGNEELNNAALEFVNRYWPTLYRAMLPYLTKSWDERLCNLVNRVLTKISFSKSFP